jgi:hypothetical protein
VTGWGDILEGADPLRRYDWRAVKLELPLEWVLARRGIAMEPSGERLIGFCPFHDDGDSPSFAVFSEPGDERPFLRVGCWSCGDFQTGDVFDLLQRFHQVPRRQALQVAGQLLQEFRQDSSWVPRAGTAPAREKADPADLLSHAREANEMAQGPLRVAVDRLVHEKTMRDPGWARVTAEYLIGEWGVGAESEHVVTVPHLSRRPDTGEVQCLGYKTRTAQSPLISRAGSDLSQLYGAWRVRGHEAVVLLEGESDCWTTWLEVGEWADVLGLPSGASARIKDAWGEAFRGKDVVLAFDGDLAGRRAARKWWLALRNVARSVRVSVLPDDHDMSSVASRSAVVAGAVEVPPSDSAIDVLEGRYARFPAGEGAPVVVSNWTFDPSRELTFPDGSAGWEGRVRGGSTVLTTRDLDSEASLRKWTSRHNGNWKGTTRDAQDIQGTFQSAGPFLARGRATTVVGWHDGHFVLPNGYIGPDYWRWVPPPAAVPLDGLRVEQGPWDPSAIELMLRINRRNVVDPILAWLAAAPVRVEFGVFPFLAVTGSSGTGKTSMVEALLDAFGWRIHTTLTGTTPHAVQAFAGATNGVPVWFDEYRTAARPDSKQALDQVLRDAYDMTASFKGGGSADNRIALTAMPTTAPIVVTGEDAFSETSHFERMVLVKLDRRDRSEGALRALLRAETAGLGMAYLTWLVARFRDGSLPSLEIDRTAGRVAANAQILGVGWQLLNQFYGEATGGDLGAPDFSKYRTDIDVATSSDPITEAMVWGQNVMPYGSTNPVVYAAGDDVIVRVEALVAEVQRARIHVLPGGVNAVVDYLANNWQAGVTSIPGQGRVYVLPGMAGRLALATAGQ